MNNRETIINESELMGELRDIKNIKMEVVSASMLYGNTLKIVGLGYLYAIIVFLLHFIFAFLCKQVPIAIVSPLIIMTSIIYFFMPVWLVLSFSYSYFLFKEGIAPYLRYGTALCWRASSFIKRVLFVHFTISVVVALLAFFIKNDEGGAVIGAFFITLGVTIIIFLIASVTFKMELIRLGVPNLLEMIKDIVKPGSKVNG